MGELLRALELPVDGVATSAQWGVAKPDPRFFGHVVDLAQAAPRETVYVGDYPALDIRPAKAAGLQRRISGVGRGGIYGRSRPTRRWRTGAWTR